MNFHEMKNQRFTKGWKSTSLWKWHIHLYELLTRWHFYEGRKSKDNEDRIFMSFWSLAQCVPKPCHELFWLQHLISSQFFFSWIFILYVWLVWCKTRNYQNSVSFKNLPCLFLAIWVRWYASVETIQFLAAVICRLKSKETFMLYPLDTLWLRQIVVKIKFFD